MYMIGGEHVGIRNIVRLHLLDVFRVRHSDQYVLTRDSKCLAENSLDVGDMLEHFENQNRIERAIGERQQRIDADDWKPMTSGFAKILKVDVASDALDAFPHQRAAVGAVAATQIECRCSGVTSRKPHKCAVMFARFGGQAGLVVILTFANHGHEDTKARRNWYYRRALIGMRDRFLLATSFLYLVIANAIWIARDTRPPFWDMAYHQTGALRIYDAFASMGIAAIGAVPRLSGLYPPLYHSVVAIFYAVFGKTVDAAQWANVPAIALLFIATYGLGRTVLKPTPAAAAAVLVNFYPILLWLSRETLIDYWLTSMVALAMWLLVRKRMIAFGIVCGLGMLTKPTFAFFLVLPAVWFARKNLKDAAIAAGIAAVIASYWYVGSLSAMAQLLAINAAGGANEGDPGRFSLQAVIFYIRALEGYQLFLPLFIAFIAGGVLLARKFDEAWAPIVLWIAGGWLGLMLFQNKDPRYSAPLLPAIALITAKIFERKEVLIAVLIPFLLFQHYLVSFGIRQLPERIVLARGIEGPLSWHWNMYTQTYFDLWGKPMREDWQIGKVLEKVSAPNGRPVRVGMIPDIPRFDLQAFQFYITLSKLPVTVNRLAIFDRGGIENNDYILLSENDQGWAPNYSHDLNSINQYILGHPESFHIVETFPLPNRDVIRLYKVGSS